MSLSEIEVVQLLDHESRNDSRLIKSFVASVTLRMSSNIFFIKSSGISKSNLNQ